MSKDSQRKGALTQIFALRRRPSKKISLSALPVIRGPLGVGGGGRKIAREEKRGGGIGTLYLKAFFAFKGKENTERGGERWKERDLNLKDILCDKLIRRNMTLNKVIWQKLQGV